MCEIDSFQGINTLLHACFPGKTNIVFRHHLLRGKPILPRMRTEDAILKKIDRVSGLHDL